MPTGDPIKILLKHNQWATAQMIAACRLLGSDQFHQRFEIGCGSLHDSLNHILGAMQLAGQLPGGVPHHGSA